MGDILHFAETARQKTILPFCVKYFAELEIFRMCKAIFAELEMFCLLMVE